MSSRDVVRRLRAWQAGQPLERHRTRHLAIAADEDVLLLAFVRMGGESLPWGVAYARPAGQPTVHVVPEARNRDEVAGMLASFAPALLRALNHPQLDQLAENAEPHDVALRQLWVPNPSHVSMLHLLSYRYTFARRGEPARMAMLNALGRAAGWAFAEAQRAGQASVIDATAALRGAFEFPADDLRQHHLGFLLALLRDAPSRSERFARAEQAEGESISVTLDPALERDTLEPLLERYHAAEERRDERAQQAAAQAIRGELETELRRRLELTETALRRLRADARPVNPGAAELAVESTRERIGEYLHTERRILADERAWVPDPETDRHPSAAASAYLKHNAAAEALGHALIHHDEELQSEAIERGDGLRGTVVRVEDRSESTRATRPFWTIESAGRAPLRLRHGATVCLAGLPRREAKIRELELCADGSRRVVIEITGWKTKPKDPSYAHIPHAADRSQEGVEITLLGASAGFLAFTKRRKVWDRDGAGAWLTHGVGHAPAPAGRAERDPLAVIDSLRRT